MQSFHTNHLHRDRNQWLSVVVELEILKTRTVNLISHLTENKSVHKIQYSAFIAMKNFPGVSRTNVNYGSNEFLNIKVTNFKLSKMTWIE